MKKAVLFLLVIFLSASILLVGMSCKSEVITTSIEETIAGESSTVATTVAAETQTEEAITIKIWDFMAGEPFDNAYKELIQVYKTKHPNVTIERIGYNIIEYDELIKTAILNDTLPDLFELYQGPQLCSVAEQGILFDFTDVIKNDPEWSANLGPSINFPDLYDLDNRMRAVSMDQFHQAMWGFRDVLAEMGKTEEDVRGIKTMDELGKFCQDLKSEGNEKWYMSSGLLGGYIIREIFYGFIGKQTGGKGNPGLEAEMGERSWTEPIFINAANGIKALSQITREDALSLDYQTDHYDIIINHQAWGSVYDGPWSVGILDSAYVDENLFAFHYPSVAEGDFDNTYVGGGGDCMAMLKDNPNTDAILEFLKFLNSAEAAPAMIKQNILPAGKIPDDIEAGIFFNSMVSDIKNSVLVPFITYTPEIEQSLIDNLTKVFQGTMTAEQAMENVDIATKDYLASK